MSKIYAVVFALFLAILLSANSWDESSARPGDEDGGVASYAIGSGRLLCAYNFVPDRDGLKCICPEGRKISWDGKCKLVEPLEDASQKLCCNISDEETGKCIEYMTCNSGN